MSEQPVQEVTMQDLGLLPLRATVAFAARCACRVQGVLQAEPYSPAKQATLERARVALELAESFARDEGAALPTSAELLAAAQQTYQAADGVAGSGRFAAYAAGHAA